MNDQASGVLKGWISNLEAAGKGASDTENKNKTLGQSFDNLVAKAKEASVAIAAVWASNHTAQESIAQFSEYEKGLFGVAQTTGQVRSAIGGFESDLNDLSKTLKVIPIENLEHFAETAGRLGLRGSQDILSFTSTAAKLQAVLKVSDDGVQAMGRMLFATGELETKGVKSVTDFSNALAAVQPNTKATAEELVQFTSSLGTNTAAFHIASTALLGLGAAAAQSNLPLQLTGTVVGQAFIRIKDAALSGSQGMQMITRATGVTQDQFQDLLNSKPQEAFLVLLSAINKLNKEGSSTPLLNALQLQGAEYQRVFTTLGANIDTVREKMKQGQEGAAKGNVLDSMFGDFQSLTAEKTSGLTRAFDGLVRDVGKALAPIYNAIVTPVTGAFDAIDTAFRALDSATSGWGTTIVASLAVIGPGVAGAATAIKVLGPMALDVLKAFSGWNVIKTIVSGAFGALPGVLSGVTAAFGVLRTAVVAFAGPWGIAAAAAVAAATLIYENWDKLKGLLPEWLTGGVEAIANGLGKAYDYVKGTVKGWFTSDNDKPKLGVVVDQKSVEDAKKQIDDQVNQNGGRKYTLNADQLTALKSLSPQIEGRVNLNLQQNALDAARKQLQAAGGQSFTEANSGLQITEEDVRRAEQIANYQKQVAQNPLYEQSQGLNDQIKAAQALNADQKNELAIRQAIRDTVNKTGEDEAKVTAEIGNRMRLLQQSQQQSALVDQARTIQQQTAALGAVTAQEQSRANIVKQINDFEREHGTLLDADKQKLVDMLATYNQQAEAVRLLNSLDPRGNAEAKYQSELKTLDVLRQQGQISQQLYQADVQRLNYQRSQSDPTTKHIQDLRDELRISQLSGDQAKIEQTALQERNTLQQQGVVITQQLNEQIQKYAEAKVAADNANTQGFSGWAKSVGTLQENLNKLQENFADGLSDAITGALTGQQGSIRSFLANFGKQMLSTGIKQIMAQNITAFTGGGSGATAQANGALNQIEALSKSGINSPQATVNATTAIINGQVQGGNVGGFAPSNSQISAGANPTTTFTPAPAAPAIPSVSSIGPTSSANTVAPSALAASAPSASVINDAAAKAATTALPAFAQSPAFAAAAAAASKSVVGGQALQDITGATVQSLPPSQTISPIAAATQQVSSGGAGAAFDLAKTQMNKVEGSSDINGFLNNGLKLQGFDNIDAAQTAWCSAFVNSSLAQVGLKGSGSLTASSFRNVGKPVDFKDLQKGDIAVTPGVAGHLVQPGQTGNHVGFATGQTRTTANGEQQFEFMAGNDSHSGTSGAVDKYWRSANGVEFRRPTELANGQPIGSEVAKATEATKAAQPVQLDKTSLDALTKGPLPEGRFDTSVPASIRNNNPGALNYAPWEQKYGAQGGTLLNDGTGQGNKISAFPTPEAGGAAQFDWWANKSPNHGPTIGDNLGVFSGGNSTKGYQDFLQSKGFGPETNIQEMLANKDQAIQFGKAQSQWEGGQQFPMNDDQWSKSYDLFKQNNPPAGAGAAMTTGSIDTSGAQQQIQQLNTTLQQTGQTTQAAVQPLKTFDQTQTTIGQSTQQAQTGMQQLSTSSQMAGTNSAAAAPSFTTLGTAAQTSGSEAQTAGSSFQSAGSQIQAAGSSAQSAGGAAGGATGDIGGFGGSISGLLGPLASAKGGIGSFGSSIMGLVQQLLSGAGGGMGGGGGGGLFGGIGSLFGGLFAEGGQIKGPGTGTSDSIMAQVSNGEFIVNAASSQKNLPLLHAINNDKLPGNMPKFANGGVVGGGSSLSIGERAVGRSSAQPSPQVAALSNQVAALSKVVSNAGANGQRTSNFSQNITVNANDAGSFRRSEGQLTSDAFLKMNRAARRNG